ncbi:ROK family protein [Acidisoma cladoniae]|jgi:glucokinase|uniref:ROK family protein n=1 Tax=Acidisoma cladoniae TaxID=3040935 RepID=UPI002550F049|nr:ROK family protein [Acidisoma sp. PAMC 29798]
MREAAFAIDLGGTELRAALIDRAGDILACATMPTDAKGGPASVMAQIAMLTRDVRDQAPDAAVIGLGVGAPGPLDPVAGIVIAAPTLTGWRNVPIGALLSAQFGLPVHLENDANAAAIGEWRFGAGRGARSIVFVTVSTGIGGGVIADGRILHGRQGLAAEIGHMTIAQEGEPCFCGTIGCWEALASGSALGRRGTCMTRAGDGSILRALSANGAVSGRHVIEAARMGDAQARALVAEEARWLGIGFVNLLHLYSPERLILGGGIANGLDLMRPVIAETIAARAMPPYRDVPLVVAALGGQAGLMGAASLVFSASAAAHDEGDTGGV